MMNDGVSWHLCTSLNFTWPLSATYYSPFRCISSSDHPLNVICLIYCITCLLQFVLLSNLSERCCSIWNLILQSINKLHQDCIQLNDLLLKVSLRSMTFFRSWNWRARWCCDGDRWLLQSSASLCRWRDSWWLFEPVGCQKAFTFENRSTGLGWESQSGEVCEGEANDSLSLTRNAAAKVSLGNEHLVNPMELLSD